MLDYGSTDFKIFYSHNALLGFSNGLIMAFLGLSSKIGYLIGGGLIGVAHSLVYTYCFRYFIAKSYASVLQEDQYVDKNF